jgi:hypothetical protein
VPPTDIKLETPAPIISDSDIDNDNRTYSEYHAQPFINISPKLILKHSNEDNQLIDTMARSVKAYSFNAPPLTAIKNIMTKNSTKDRRMKSRIMYHYAPESLTFPTHFIRNVGYLIKNPHAVNRLTMLNHTKKLKSWSSKITAIT